MLINRRINLLINIAFNEIINNTCILDKFYIYLFSCSQGLSEGGATLYLTRVLVRVNSFCFKAEIDFSFFFLLGGLVSFITFFFSFFLLFFFVLFLIYLKKTLSVFASAKIASR